MRLDRVNLRAVSDILRAMVQEALMEPGKVVRMALPTSPADGVQVFVRAGQEAFSWPSAVLGARRTPGRWWPWPRPWAW